MSSPASLESFERELNRLVAKFEKEFGAATDPGYSEARLRQDYLDPFIRALGWDLENHAGLVQQQREVEIESRTDVAGRSKARHLYLIKPDRTRALDTDFLEFLDKARRELAGDLLKHNDRADILANFPLLPPLDSCFPQIPALLCA